MYIYIYVDICARVGACPLRCIARAPRRYSAAAGPDRPRLFLECVLDVLGVDGLGVDDPELREEVVPEIDEELLGHVVPAAADVFGLEP